MGKKGVKEFSCSDSDSNSHQVISKPLLPQDLIFDILTFLSINCLTNSAMYVCKTWAATITSFRFAEVHQRRARSKHGLYVQSLVSGISSYFLEFKNDDVNGQYEKFDLGTPEGMGDVIASCDGILLLSNDSSQIFAANPSLKCWLRIPCFPSSVRLENMIIRFQCTIARVPGTSEFKVFLLDVLDVLGSAWFFFHVLRIGIDNSWKEIARREAPLNQLLCWKPIYNGGNDLYWVTMDEVIVMNVDKEIVVSEYPIRGCLVDGLGKTFLWMGDCLSCIDHEDIYGTFKIFVLNFDSRKWSLYHEMGPFDYGAACGHELHVSSVSFRMWINDQIIFHADEGFASLKNIHFGYNVKTRQLTKIDGINKGGFVVCRHINSLASLPSTTTDV
ncbi:uncharacterized protein LOC131618056 isoform X1 [Vicia villosa]|uniref:uncharacterized protein LOC131618056 isoform X1 n=1 Tax=Vicia villosa TaxID=3911 RepID=UPI00273AC77C|nr:uncharacterized protein LOC131618056 isoform X1 [Vicia villosa]XP_058745305.1 uncharacterized protein LOC131618056 isoform X1 [Vicia villosa]